MQRLRLLRAVRQASLFERLCETVEQAPDAPLLECVMPGLSPFMQHSGDHAIGTHADISGSDDDVMGLAVVDGAMLVGGEPGALVMPFLQHAANASLLGGASSSGVLQIFEA